MRPLAVFDLDGTLCDVRHRLHFLRSQPKDWDGFFTAARHDPALQVGIDLVLRSATQCDIAYLTGRPERCRNDTVSWLAEHGLPAGELAMRATRDRRTARVAKPRLLHRLAAGRTVAVVVDDDAEVCTALTEQGWPVLRADWQDPAPELTRAQEESGRT